MSKEIYAELHCHSAYSFLDGASLPQDLLKRAAELELEALFLTDHQGFPGIMQLASSAYKYPVRLGVGTELTLAEHIARTSHPDPQGEHLLILAKNVEGYRQLSSLIGNAMLASEKPEQMNLNLDFIAESAHNAWLILTGCRKGRVRRALEETPGVWAKEEARKELQLLIECFGRENVLVELTDARGVYDRERCEILKEIADKEGVVSVATGNVHYASPENRIVADVLASVRSRLPLEKLAPYLPAQGHYLRSASQMQKIFSYAPEVVENAGYIGREYSFDLRLLAPNLPAFPVPSGHNEASWLEELVRRGAVRRYGSREQNPQAWKQIRHELDIINALGFPGYFLIVEEIVAFCRENDIWCQGRGSAANSAVCYALGITPVDAVQHKMLFERFLSPDRIGPPDIDIDIEARRREEVIQHVYQRYGRDYAAQVATIITYRPKSAIRDAAFAFGYENGQADHWAGSYEHQYHWESDTKESGIPQEVLSLASQLLKLPRHRGIHSGGMVLCDRPLTEVCPVLWAKRFGRTILQWDKDDCAEAGLVKFDLLGLGILTAFRLSFSELAKQGLRGENGKELGLYNLPQEDPRVYDLLCAADTVGVFQVESRAQISTLPRLAPRCFYDIVVEVALIRPGPIQGDSVSPYLKRRNGKEDIEYLHPLLKPALEKTLGVPLFQEQLMQIAIDAAGFSPAQADKLRKAMGSKRSHERMQELQEELYAGMRKRGICQEIAEKIFWKLEGFAEFGFPESHAFSFAYLVYASAWLKVHHPETFYMGILNSQPMGFYSPQSLISDARRHGVKVLPVDVCYSSANRVSIEVSTEYLLQKDRVFQQEKSSTPTPQGNILGTSGKKSQAEERNAKIRRLVDPSENCALRIGFGSIKGIEHAAERIIAARENAPFRSVEDLAQRAQLSTYEIAILARAGALSSLHLSRRQGMWIAGMIHESTKATQLSIPGLQVLTDIPNFPDMADAEKVNADLETTGITQDLHPLSHMRSDLEKQGILSVAQTREYETGRRIFVAGLITHRQRPSTARGVTFLSLEDETGILNVVCSSGLWERYQSVLRRSNIVVLRGMIEKAERTMNLIADHCSALEAPFPTTSRDFR